MNAITNIRIFVDTGSYQREKEDLSFHLFNNLDFTTNKRHISFFRSDFRGSRFVDVKFYRNNFNRADFISCTFRNCSFDVVAFGCCEMKNCYFENVTFDANNYNNMSVQQCSFINCNFKSEHFLMTMYDCNFNNCRFEGCSFEQSSTEKLVFTNSQIYNSDLATMHAEGHVFNSCELKHVCIDVSYVFGYLFYETKTDDIDFLYRGEIVNLKSLTDLSKRLLIEQRFFEFINANMIFKAGNDIADIIIDSFDKLCIIDISQFRKNEMCNILSAICFYVNKSMLPFRELTKLIMHISSFNWRQFPFDEYIEYLSKIEKINHIISAGEYKLSTKFLETIPREDFAILVLYCDTNDFDEALNSAQKLIENLLNKCKMPSAYSLIDRKKGSWELAFAIPMFCAVALPVFLKNVVKSGNICIEIDFKKNMVKKLKKMSENDDITLAELKMIAEIATMSQIVSSDTKDMSLEILDMTKDIIKSIKIGV